MKPLLPSQVRRPMPSQRGPYRTLLITGALFLVLAIGWIVFFVYLMVSSGDNEAAGFMFMIGLFGLLPAAIGGFLFIWGLVVFVKDPARRRRRI
jgi:uncharacterized membrane protein